MSEEAQRKQLSSEVVEALRMLKRGEELTSALRPLSLLRRRYDVDADGLLIPARVGGDFTVVEVGGTAVGVQADLSGAVSVGWSVLPAGEAGRQWNVAMLTRRPAVDAVRLVQAAGLLDPPSTTVG